MKRIIIALMLALALAFSLAGCGKDKAPEGPSGLVIIVGNHANSNIAAGEIIDEMMTEDPELFTNAYNVIENDRYFTAKANIAVIVADGNPEIEDLETHGFKTGYLKESNTEKKTMENIDENNETLVELFASETLKAQEEEVDLIAAVDVAVNFLNNLSNVTERNILILDTMLPSKGLVNVRTFDFENISGEELYKKVMDVNGTRMPDLSGITVQVKGAINTCENQDKRISEVCTNLLDFWKEFFGDSLKGDIIKSYGASGTPKLYKADGSGYPYVSPVAVSAPNPLDPVIFNEQQVRFNSGDWTFVDPDGAKEYIRKASAEAIKKALNSDPEAIFYVVGSIAVDSKGNEFETHEISRNRALVVADILMECGIPAKNLRVLDCGTNKLKGLRDADEFKGGSWDDDEAAKNRVVAVIHADDSADAFKVIKPFIDSTHIVK